MPEGGSGNADRACASLEGRRSPSAHFEHGTHCGSAGDEDLHRGADRRVKVAIDYNGVPWAGARGEPGSLASKACALGSV